MQPCEKDRQNQRLSEALVLNRNLRLVFGTFVNMRRCGLFISAMIAFFFAFGKEQLAVYKKTDAFYIGSKQISDDLTSDFKSPNSEFELVSNQIPNATQVNKRTHCLTGFLATASFTLDHHIAVTNGIKKNCNHFSHKTYLLHIYPFHNFW